MNLSELGFHKTSGAQKDLYVSLKKPLLDYLNSRNLKDLRQTMQTMHNATLNPHTLGTLANNTISGKGAFSSVIGKNPNKLTGKVWNNTSNQLAEQGAKQAVKRLFVSPARSTDPRYGPEQRQNSWLHLRGIDPNAASKSGDRRRGF